MNFKSLMAFMDIERDDMQTIFKVLDCDGSGEVRLKNWWKFPSFFCSCRYSKVRKINCLTSKIVNQQYFLTFFWGVEDWPGIAMGR